MNNQIAIYETQDGQVKIILLKVIIYDFIYQWI